MVELAQTGKEASRAADGAPRQSFVLGYSMADWEAWKSVVSLQDCLMPDRSGSNCSQVTHAFTMPSCEGLQLMCERLLGPVEGAAGCALCDLLILAKTKVGFCFGAGPVACCSSDSASAVRYGQLIGECAWQEAQVEEQENRNPAPRRVSAK